MSDAEKFKPYPNPRDISPQVRQLFSEGERGAEVYLAALEKGRYTDEEMLTMRNRFGTGRHGAYAFGLVVTGKCEGKEMVDDQIRTVECAERPYGTVDGEVLGNFEPTPACETHMTQTAFVLHRELMIKGSGHVFGINGIQQDEWEAATAPLDGEE